MAFESQSSQAPAIPLAQSRSPCPDNIAAVMSMTEAMYDVAYIGDMDDSQVKDSICSAVHEMCEAGTSVEAALACVKQRLRRITMGGALDLRDDIKVAWLSDHLVRWVIECYY